MFYHPAGFALGIRDVIAAWLVCLTLVAVLFIFAALENSDEAGEVPALAGTVMPTLETAAHTSCNAVHSCQSGMELWVVSSVENNQLHAFAKIGDRRRSVRVARSRLTQT
jgi:hypothetical protein